MMIGGFLARAILSRFVWHDMTGEVYLGKSKLELSLGAEIWSELKGKSVIDFGCGDGAEAVEIAIKCPHTRVIGVDINEALLERARGRAREADVEDRCVFSNGAGVKADVIISIDTFEHFQDPDGILRVMNSLLNDQGRVLISFGPPWFHPWGSHCLVFPWAHVILTERSIMEWRERYKQDGAKRYSDGSGGVNKMTIARFFKVVENSPFEVEWIRLIPIRKTGWFHNRWTREFTTAVVRARLVKKSQLVSKAA